MPNQFTGPKYRYPDDNELVGLFRRYGYMAAVAKVLEIPRGSIRGYLNRRPELKKRVAAVCWGRAGLNTKEKYTYPSDADLLYLIARHRTVGRTAIALRIPDATLSAYIARNPHLKIAVEEIKARDWHNQERQRERRKRYSKEWHKNNFDYQRDYNRKRRAEKRDHINAVMRRWYRDNKERPSILRNRIRRNQLQHTGHYTDPETLDYIVLLKRDPCSYCGCFSDHMAVDHIEPVSRGAEHHWSNMTSACRSCNAAKRDRPLLSFLLTMRR